MIALGLTQAKKFSNSPILIAKNLTNESKNVYWVEDSSLPCQNCDNANPLSMLEPERIWKLRKQYGISAKVLKKIEECYKDPKSESVALGKAGKQLNCRLFLKSIEDDIIKKLKGTVRLDGNADLMPYYDEAMIRERNTHSVFSGPSCSGKTTLCAKVIKHNFEEATAWVFGPLVSQCRIWLGLQKDRGKKNTKVIDSGKVQVPVDIREISHATKPNLLVLDDPDAMEPRSRHLLQELCSASLFHGRHLGICCFQICHDSFSRKLSSQKAVACEATRIFCFPNIARHVTTKLLKGRLGMSNTLIKEIYAFIKPSDRWMMVKLDHPVLVLTQTGCKLLN